MRSKPSEITRGRRGERGAALVMALLVAMLLLAAGGALIATAGMTASNAVDATAEAQAYYAADAGLQAALTVLRRNREGAGGLEANFHNIACGTTAACTNDGNDLSQWLTYEANGRVTLSDSPDLSYSLTVTDPGLAGGANLAPTYHPHYLLIQSVGRGPKGAVKVMEMMVSRFKFDYDAPATLVLREAKNANPHVSIIPGPGQPNLYSGTDVANPTVTKPAVGVGNTVYNSTTDFAAARTAMSGETMTGGVGVVGSGGTPWPDIVADAESAATAVSELRAYARTTACPGSSQALSGFTFIQGNCTLGPQNSGSGLLVITGNLTMSGNFNFSGLIFALGTGRVERSGGGGGTVQGGILAANFTGNGSTGFGQVVFDTSGGGNSQIRYNSLAIEEALALLGPRLLGVVEK